MESGNNSSGKRNNQRIHTRARESSLFRVAIVDKNSLQKNRGMKKDTINNNKKKMVSRNHRHKNYSREQQSVKQHRIRTETLFDDPLQACIASKNSVLLAELYAPSNHEDHRFPASSDLSQRWYRLSSEIKSHVPSRHLQVPLPRKKSKIRMGAIYKEISANSGAIHNISDTQYKSKSFFPKLH